MKKCFKCSLVKPLSGFYRHPKMGDGYLNKCKECVKYYVRKHREENIEAVMAYDRTRGNTDKHRKRNREIRAAALSTEEGRARINSYSAKWRAAQKEKRAAHLQVQYAINSGRLIRASCARCGKDNAHAHHEDYSKPLEVMWLCIDCHGERHREINEERRSHADRTRVNRRAHRHRTHSTRSGEVH